MSTPRFPALLEAWGDRAGLLTSTSFIKQRQKNPKQHRKR